MNASQMTLEEYRAAVADLPRPTAEQMHEFVRYVASAHSWYKHLPLWPPGRQFTFFLDPGAGMQRVVTADGSMDVIDREVQGFHYSWLPTREHRQRFGFLAYARSAGTTVKLGYPGVGQLVPADDDAAIFDPEQFRLVPLPLEIQRAGIARVSALVHTHTLSYPDMFVHNYVQHFMRHPPLPDGDDHRIASQVIAERTRILCTSGCVMLREGAWPMESGGIDTLSAILARCCALMSDPSRKDTVPYAIALALGEEDLAMVDNRLVALIAPERTRQLHGMVAAMERVLALIPARN